MPDTNSSMKFAILKMLDEGEKDYEVIASEVGCSVRWVQEVAAKRGKFIPATLEEDLNLVEELANDFDGRDKFAAGVRWLGKSLMFSCRLLGQLSAVPTMGRVGELTELITLARAMEHKPAPPDPALIASLNNVSQSMAKMAAPKTPQMAMMGMMEPLLQGMMANVMRMFGGAPGGTASPGGSPSSGFQRMSDDEREAIFGGGQ